jgi:hypothetical protein
MIDRRGFLGVVLGAIGAAIGAARTWRYTTLAPAAPRFVGCDLARPGGDQTGVTSITRRRWTKTEPTVIEIDDEWCWPTVKVSTTADPSPRPLW